MWGYINIDGEWAIDPQFQQAWRFSEGLAAVSLDNEHGAYIDTGGQFVIGPEHGDYGRCWGEEDCRFADGLAAKPNESGDWGYIDKSGAWAIEPRFAGVGVFSEGLAVVSTPHGTKYGYIDTAGEWVIEPQFSQATPFTRTTP